MASSYRRDGGILQSGFAEILQGLNHIDLQVVTSDGTLYFHQLLLAVASNMMRTILEHADIQHHNLATLILPDFTHADILELIQFLYGLRSFGEKLSNDLVQTLQVGFEPLGADSVPLPDVAESDISDTLEALDADSPSPSIPEPSIPQPSPSPKRRTRLARNVHNRGIQKSSQGWKCVKCQVEKRFYHQFKDHQQSCGPTSSKPADKKMAKKRRVKTKEQVSARLISCGGCSATFPSFQPLLSHFETHLEHRDLTLVCQPCQTVFPSQQKFEKHKLIHQKELQCRDCGKVFSDIKKYSKHLTNVHPNSMEGEYKCSKCSRSFEYPQNFVNHMKQHDTEDNGPIRKDYKCKHCQQLFPSKSTLSYHVAKHVQSEFSCHRCPKKFKSDKGLKYHMNVHDGVHDYLCDDCGRGFITRQKLLQHRRAKHTFEKPYVCDTCGEGFTRSDKMNLHKRRAHTGEKPYNCDQCSWKGVDSSGLIHHRKKHEGATPKITPTTTSNALQLPAIVTEGLVGSESQIYIPVMYVT
ncbi:hypothetical protein TCAL_08109 [Tigriopus californicus]|uniref:BTB domain-containing protein n=2 Tax=Tigriopus californicus TaxID=6832 RepID=A0A553PLI8_TIGCA|nr:zinc finger protein 629-like isoform X2 [Tigriopus californicus]TRY78529.1 hypothetical protein TCAL_08109 [Tigriopus californicus]|eukprot:TCALIF_08109-PA protein Name:"Similar to ZNF879 Zinc finger protein 879 (Homo sapiens)" AED:0.06 eAED:0.06 QI:0/-1/0/1/-1/1/1/0/523